MEMYEIVQLFLIGAALTSIFFVYTKTAKERENQMSYKLNPPTTLPKGPPPPPPPGYTIVYNSATSGGTYEVMEKAVHDIGNVGSKPQSRFVVCKMCQGTTPRGKPCEYCGRATE